MMPTLGVTLALQQILNAQQEQKMEKAFYEAIKDLPFETRHKLRRERQAQKEKIRHEEAIERRHQETCQAIRSTSFWRF